MENSLLVIFGSEFGKGKYFQNKVARGKKALALASTPDVTVFLIKNQS